MTRSLDASHRAQIRERGISDDEIERQLDLLDGPRKFTRLVRPCTVGDGIRRIEEDELEGLLATHAAAAAAGRFTKFVPASGAATRMFRELLEFRSPPRRDQPLAAVRTAASGGDATAQALLRFLEQCSRFPFGEALRSRMAADGADVDRCVAGGRFLPILDTLLGDAGLGYARAPKGLLLFHRYPDQARTAFEEHLVEAAEYVRDRNGDAKLHFTVSPEHREGFAALLDRIRGPYEQRLRASFQVTYSTQKFSTDTVAIDSAGRLFSDEAGRLVFRPAGHGALIENLNDLDADLVYIKNIDNVQPDRVKPRVSRWKRALGGYLVKLEQRTRTVLEQLRGPSYADRLQDAARFAATRLHVELNGRLDPDTPDTARAWLVDRLSRPLRVCGVVPNTGEPGGGPFWVRDGAGRVSLQLVETAQIDQDDPEQCQAFSGATHFSPVDLVCALRDPAGRVYDLDRFIDHEAGIVTEKSAGGRALRVLERPGLWNGAMARWNTVFVEVPLETFTPVKTVFDLLRPEHQTVGD